MQTIELGPNDAPPEALHGTTVAASLKVNGARDWTDDGRREVARWLRRQAYFIEKHGHEFADVYRSRYLTRDVEDAMDARPERDGPSSDQV
jgi:hypothetical protein